jgi:hypothetical protein
LKIAPEYQYFAALARISPDGSVGQHGILYCDTLLVNKVRETQPGAHTEELQDKQERQVEVDDAWGSRLSKSSKKPRHSLKFSKLSKRIKSHQLIWILGYLFNKYMYEIDQVFHSVFIERFPSINQVTKHH